MTDSGMTAGAKRLGGWLWNLPKRAVNRVFRMPGRAPVLLLAAGIVLLLVSAYPLFRGNVDGAATVATLAAVPFGLLAVFFVIEVLLERLFERFFGD